jgi:hypothetical protein
VVEIPTPAQTVKILVSFSFCPPNGRLTPTVPEGGPIIMASSRPSSPDPDPSKRRKVTASGPNVKCCIPRLVIRRSDTDKTVKNLSPFYIQKALDQIGGAVRNASRLRDGSLLVETQTEEQTKKLLKQKLLGHILLQSKNIKTSTRLRASSSAPRLMAAQRRKSRFDWQISMYPKRIASTENRKEH